MYTILIVLIVIVSILMCFIVLIQESKGGGLASGFAASNQIMGVRKTTDIIEKTTWTLAILMVVLSVASSYVIPTATGESTVIENTQTTVPSLPQQNAAPIQGQGQPTSSTSPTSTGATPN